MYRNQLVFGSEILEGHPWLENTDLISDSKNSEKKYMILYDIIY